jgi:ribosomal protein S18 acetylase RimI-like enzyme
MNKENIQVKVASVDDAEEILTIQKDAFLGQAKIYKNDELPPLTQSLDSIKNEFKTKTFLKVLFNGRIIASVRFEEKDNFVTIDRIVVSPVHQNKGIGTALLQAIETMSPSAIAFQLFTGNKSARNIHLYEKLGYEIINRKTTDQGIELLHMEKRP